MRSDAEWLEDIMDAIVAIERYRPASREQFNSNEPLQSHLLRQLQIIGEAVARISDEFKSQHENVPWRKISGMRNAIVHVYFQIDWNEVWNTIVNDVSVLKSQIQNIRDSM